ncbi:MAG: hypothetical protein IPK08_15595 [Bacteroidetes bacterium]|nr:hypothetical protein [Bacteroidota bacterium]
MNNEGLAGDPKFNRLLIAAKSKPLNHDVKSERYIYAYDLTKNKLIQEPVYSLNVDRLATNGCPSIYCLQIPIRKGYNKGPLISGLQVLQFILLPMKFILYLQPISCLL